MARSVRDTRDTRQSAAPATRRTPTGRLLSAVPTLPRSRRPAGAARPGGRPGAAAPLSPTAAPARLPLASPAATRYGRGSRYYARNVAAAGQEGVRVGRRSARYRLRQVLWRESLLERTRRCGRGVLGSAVAVRRQGGVAHFAGLETCGSVWACPCCAAKILNGRAAEVAAAAGAWQAAGNTVMMASLTMSHDDGMRLAPLLVLVAGLWRRVQQTRRWRELRRRHRLAHLVRSLEVTHGANGWHPHLHVLLFLRGPADGMALGEVRAYLRAKWAADLVKAGYRRPHQDYGVDVRWCYSAAEAGLYVAKVQDGRAVGNELARGDLKQGKDGHRTPLEILAGFAATGDVADRSLWREYEAASKGHQRISWSAGARAELLPELPEQTDEELAAEEVGGDLLGTISARDWWRAITPVLGLPAAVLEAAERGRAELVAVLAAAGVSLDLPPPG